MRFREVCQFVKQGLWAFIEDNALSHGASIAFYVVTGFVPALVSAIMLLRTLFGHTMFRSYVARALHLLMGSQGKIILGIAAKAASGTTVGIRTEIVGAIVLLVTASGAFGEIQSALNAIWKASSEGVTLASFLRARLLSLALVIGLGVVLLCSMLATALVAQWQVSEAIGSPLFTAIANFLAAFVLISMVFAAIYKLLPDIDLEWGDVAVGAVGTAILYELGQLLIGLYLHSAGAAAAYSAAGGLIVVLLWIYYSAQVFLLGAEFTKIYATRRGSMRRQESDRNSPPKTTEHMALSRQA
ncbi:MAG TPA: YihY/virulence factor BrkB family protein [Rhizomicrobium sp.]|jgi:membrane protein|nr:YihY/virulence factor BrkB family protein [Rhizomicrobium sp.]